MAILILALWVVSSLALIGYGRPVREAALAAYTFVVVCALILTEVLSLAHAIAFPWLALSWAILVGLVIAIGRRRIGAGAVRLKEVLPGGRDKWDKWDVALVGIAAAFALGALVAALTWPTSNWDSMTYHLPRVLFWEQNRSVAPYPTVDGRQLFMSGLVEYLILNLRVLSRGSDVLFNLPQWFSYVFAAIGVSLIAGRLGANRRGQQVAALVAMSIPMAALQASTTQTHLTVAMWCTTAVYGIVSYIADQKPPQGEASPRMWRLGWAAVATALAIQAQAVAYLALPPFFVWLIVVMVKRDGIRRAAVSLGLMAACFLLLLSATYIRNAVILDGDFLATRAPTLGHILTKARDPVRLTTTALKNLSMLLATGSKRVDSRIVQGVSAVVRAYGGDIEDPLTKESPGQTYALPGLLLGGDTAPAPIAAVLVGASALMLLVRSERNGVSARTYIACGVGSAVLLAALVTYNHFVNRLLLTPLLILAPLSGAMVPSPGLPRRRLLRIAAGALLSLCVVSGGIALVFNYSTPLAQAPALAWKVPRVGDLGVSLYPLPPYPKRRFVLMPELEELSASIARAASAEGIERIGFKPIDAACPIYPLLNAVSDRELAYIGSTLLPERIPPSDIAPQAVIEITVPTAYSDAGAVRGEMLVPPTKVGAQGLEWIVLFYKVP